MRNIILGSMLALTTAGTARADRPAPPAEVVACAQSLGLDQAAGPEARTPEQKQQMHACLEAKGFHGGHHGKPDPAKFAAFKACVEAKGVTLPDRPPRGPRPDLDAKTRAAFDSCREDQPTE